MINQHTSKDLMIWIDDMLLLQDEERQEIVDNMLSSYIDTCSEEYPDTLGDLLIYLQEEENRIEFKKALNNINLVFSIIFTVNSRVEYYQAIRKLLSYCKTDNIHIQTMKKYYLNNLDRDDFSLVIYNDKEYSILLERINDFKEQYMLFYP